MGADTGRSIIGGTHGIHEEMGPDLSAVACQSKVQHHCALGPRGAVSQGHPDPR